MWYDLDIKKLAVLLTPTFWRSESFLAWLQSLVQPLRDVHYNFVQNRSDDLYIMAHNGQVCYLRDALNDHFDVSERRIRIVDGNQYKRQYIYTRGEEKPRYLGTMYLYDRSDYDDTGVDFVVLVPQGFDTESYAMKALIDLYRLGSKRYKIKIM